MRLIILMIVLVIGGLLIARQLQKPDQTQPEQAQSRQSVPQVPQRPQDVPAFKKSINTLVNKTNSKEKQTIEKDTQ